MAAVTRHSSLGDYLVQEGIITQGQFNKALAIQNESMRSLGRVLVDMDLITESMRMTILKKQFGFDVIRLKGITVDPMVLVLIPYSFAEKHRVVPLRMEGNRSLVVAMEDPSDLLVIDAIKNQVGMPVRPYVASHEDIQLILDQYQTGTEEQPILTATPIKRPPSKLYLFLQKTAFPVLAFLPLPLFFLAIWQNTFDLQDWLIEQREAENLQTWDLALYISLIWGLWAIILFEINGLIFGREEEEEE